MKPSPEQIAKVLGVTVEQARAGLNRSAKGIRKLTSADLQRWGKSRSQANEIAGDYENRAKP